MLVCYKSQVFYKVSEKLSYCSIDCRTDYNNREAATGARLEFQSVKTTRSPTLVLTLGLKHVTKLQVCKRKHLLFIRAVHGACPKGGMSAAKHTILVFE